MRAITLVTLLLLGLAACRKSDNGPQQPLDIYAVGVKNRIATYWKNDSAVTLSTPAGSSDGYGIAISGTDVYVAGSQLIPGHGSSAVLWKNGVPTALSGSNKDAGAMGITIQGSDVYVVGSVLNERTLLHMATCWKNGVPLRLGAEEANSGATAIAVIGADVYVIGWRNTATQPAVNCYWKNGVLADIGDTTISTGWQPSSLFVSGADIYAVWTQMNAQLKNRSFYAKNFGTPVEVQDGSAEVSACAIAVHGGDVYLAGSGPASNPTVIAAKYWKNGTPVRLSDGPRHSAALGIALDGPDVYTCGGVQTAVVANSPLYWKNGTPVKLEDSTTQGFVRQLLLKRG